MINLARTTARLVGISVAATLAVAATQLLTIGLGATPLLSSSTVEQLGSLVRRDAQPGPAIIASILLALFAALALIGAFWPRRGPAALTVRRRKGWTRIDRPSLAAACERHLSAIDRRNDITAVVRRSGRIDLQVVTTDFSVDGPATELPAALADWCDQRGLKLKPGSTRLTNRTNPRRSQTLR